MTAWASKRNVNPDSGIIRHWDRHGRIAYGPTPRTASVERSFRHFQQAVIDAGPEIGPAALAAHLVALEGIVVNSDLEAALGAASDCYQWRGGLYLEWPRGGDWRDRRRLSGTTASLIAAGITRDSAALKALPRFAGSVVPRWFGLHESEIVARLFEAGQVWAVMNLPGFLAAHVLGDVKLQPCPRSALGREQTGLAIVDEAILEPSADQIECLEAACAGHVSHDTSLILRLRAICSSGREAKGHYARARADMLRQVRDLVPQVTEHGWTTGLVLGWAIALIEVGTRGKVGLAPATISNYVCTVAIELTECLNREGVLPNEGERWQELYTEILDAVAPGSRVNAASALASFHVYLNQWLDVEPLDVALHNQLEDVPPRANIVWPHEIERVRVWLRDGHGDSRLNGALSLVLKIAASVRVRTDEILSLRMRNVVDVSGEIEVHPLRRDAPGKSGSARRILSIDAGTRVELQAWIARRRGEGAGDNDLLFGDPYNADQVYRAGAMRIALSGLLRRATGDARVVFHTLSHTWVSTQAEHLDALRGNADINPLDLISAGAGHFSPATLRHYLHLYEKWLRDELDRALTQTLRVTSALASRYTGRPAPGLRKRASRAGENWAGYWAEIDARVNGTLHASPAYADREFVEPVPPAWLAQPRRRDVEAIANVLEDLAKGISLERVALRSNCTTEEIVAIAGAALETVRLLGAWRPSARLVQVHDSRVCDAFAAWASSSTGLDLSRRHQDKFHPIRSRLPVRSAAVWSSWVETYARGYIALAPDTAGPLFRWLAQSNVSALNLAMSVECSGADPVVESPGVRALQRIFRVAFGVEPRVFGHRAGERRPPVYLIWSSGPVGDERPAPAASSLQGLHSWLLAASCFIPMEEFQAQALVSDGGQLKEEGPRETGGEP